MILALNAFCRKPIFLSPLTLYVLHKNMFTVFVHEHACWIFWLSCWISCKLSVIYSALEFVSFHFLLLCVLNGCITKTTVLLILCVSRHKDIQLSYNKVEPREEKKMKKIQEFYSLFLRVYRCKTSTNKVMWTLKSPWNLWCFLTAHQHTQTVQWWS